MEFFLDLARALNPRISDTPEQVFAWRQTVAVTLMILALVVTFNTAQMRGWLEFVGIQGYIQIGKVDELAELIKQTRQDQIIQQILDNTRRYCQSYEAGDSQGMSFAFKALQDARTAYAALTHREYPQLMCSMSAQPAAPTTR